MKRVLCIDVGSKTLGLAVSDDGGRVGLPLETIRRTRLADDIVRVRDVVNEKGVAEVVIGLPLNLDGSRGAMSDEVDRVARAVEKRCGVEVHFWDERLTTAEAERMLIGADVSRRRRRKVIDKLAATLILQSFLDARLAAEANG